MPTISSHPRPTPELTSTFVSVPLQSVHLLAWVKPTGACLGERANTRHVAGDVHAGAKVHLPRGHDGCRGVQQVLGNWVCRALGN